MKTKEKIENEFWDKKMRSIFIEKITTDEWTFPPVKAEDIASEMASELEKEIPAELIRTKAHNRSKEDYDNYLKISVRIGNSWLKFETFSRTKTNNAEMLLSFRGSRVFVIRLANYKIVTKQIIYLYNHYNQYCEKLKPILFEADKAEKTRKIAQKSIQAVTSEIMKNTNYEWNLLEEDDLFNSPNQNGKKTNDGNNPQP